MGNNSGYAVTVGFFDGVHRGHRYLAEHLKQAAAERGLMSRIVTFAEHPRHVLHSEYMPVFLCDPDRKMALLRETGADCCTQLHFTPEMAGMDARTFMSDILRDKLGAKCILMGHDHRFGHDCITDFDTYRRIGDEIGIEVIKSEALVVNGVAVSSTIIRRHIAEGAVNLAAELLGYRYSLSGTVVHGMKNGRKMGFPTANLALHYEGMQIPANGVYAGWATVSGETFKAMLNIGFRPTLDHAQNPVRSIEAHLLNFDRDIYGEDMTLEFVQYLREERRFDSMEALAARLESDRNEVDRLLIG